MEAIYLLTVLWLKEPFTYHSNTVHFAYKNMETCLEKLKFFELEYRRKEGQYVVDNYTKKNDAGTTVLWGFSSKNKANKETRFFECKGSILLDD